MTGAQRLDDVEIKITLDKPQIDRALQELGLPDDRPTWQIHFCEDVTASAGAGTPLFDLGLVLRARRKPDEPDDSTVKLRPCRRSQLTDDWLAVEEADGVEVKVEADWAGSGHALAASCTADRSTGLVRAVADGQQPISALFHERQIAFLRQCFGSGVNLATLTLLPPVTAMRWKKSDAAPADLKLRAERWTVDELDFLELSIVAPPERARARQAALTGFVQSLGITVDPTPEPKTGRVIAHLVDQMVAGAG
jgi:hypothetical protein